MRTLVAAALLAAIATPAFAQSSPRIDQRQYNQERRIEQGYRSGTLTAQEAWRLDRGQRRIDRMEHQALRDGYVSPRERARIEAAQDRQSRRIARQKRDWQHY